MTGPTGSGKTTTLYSMLRAMQGRGVNIVTVEDPVEYRLQGIVQVQVNEKAGLTFPRRCARSCVRTRTSSWSARSATRRRRTSRSRPRSRATSCSPRCTPTTRRARSPVCVDIGVESYKIACGAQGRRSPSASCAGSATACRALSVGQVAERLQRWIPEGATLHRAVGCNDCSMTGYRGRLAIEEVLQANDEVERRIAGNETVERINDAARETGRTPLALGIGDRSRDRGRDRPRGAATRGGGSARPAGAATLGAQRAAALDRRGARHRHAVPTGRHDRIQHLARGDCHRDATGRHDQPRDSRSNSSRTPKSERRAPPSASCSSRTRSRSAA